MGTTLVVPGVRVEARFDILPPLPAAAGILGVVGIVDHAPADDGLISVSNATEARQLLGMGTQASLPEVFHALSNGVSEAVVSAVAGGASATLTLLNANSKEAVTLRTRSKGAWGNGLSADVRAIADAKNNIVRVAIRLLANRQVLESFSDLQSAPGQPDDLFDTINRSSRYVIAIDPGFATSVPAPNTYTFNANGDPIDIPENGGARKLFQLLPGIGVDPHNLSVRIQIPADNTILVQVFQGGLQEQFPSLLMDPDSDNYLPHVLLTQSQFVRVRPLSSLAAAEALPAATDAPVPFKNGASPTVDQYRSAIDRLADDTRVDLVMASVEPGRPAAEARQIHQALVAHAVNMADKGAPRIAFGSVTTGEQKDLAQIKDHAASVRNRRFVLVSPSGAEGAVAGVIGRLNPQDSPTFKPVPLFSLSPAKYRESELNRLLGSTTNLLVVQDRAGHGVVVLKGIDTTGDQISVTRVADEAIRETKAISENFIGSLNTEDARAALKQQIVATFTRMERAGALVPSTDGSDPAFIVNVYSTQQDFAQGTVRIDIAVRPVRAIDYIYATIRVKN